MRDRQPIQILTAIAVAAAALMAVYNLALRQSGFGVTVGYQLPEPPARQGESQLPEYSAPWAEEAQAPAAGAPAEESRLVSVQFPLELNRATQEELKFIPQVGEVLSQRIVQYRDHLGGYTDLAQLMEIKGIGEGTYLHITAYLYLEEEAAPEEPEQAGASG